MTLSIRKFLLVNLLLAIAIITTLSAVGNYYLDRKNIQRHLDSLMALSTLSYEALLSDEIDSEDLNNIQNSLNKIPGKLKKNYPSYHHIYKTHQTGHFNLQVWDKQGNLLLKTPNLPELPPVKNYQGFKNILIDDELWRAFYTYAPVD